jgi:YHS domain-containing protein
MPRRLVRLTASIFAVAFLTGAVPALAGESKIYTGFLSGVAVGGYDPVAYFGQGRAVEGSSKFEFEYKGASWRFANRKNLDQFRADPEAYAPQYGGYCAWAVSQGYTAKGDPQYWRIVKGKLYLNYDASVQKRWEKDIPGFIRKANTNWPKVLE